MIEQELNSLIKFLKTKKEQIIDDNLLSEIYKHCSDWLDLY